MDAQAQEKKIPKTDQRTIDLGRLATVICNVEAAFYSDPATREIRWERIDLIFNRNHLLAHQDILARLNNADASTTHWMARSLLDETFARRATEKFLVLCKKIPGVGQQRFEALIDLLVDLQEKFFQSALTRKERDTDCRMDLLTAMNRRRNTLIAGRELVEDVLLRRGIDPDWVREALMRFSQMIDVFEGFTPPDAVPPPPTATPG